MTRNGLDLGMLRQGSFFTATGKQKVPGSGESYGTARELMRYLCAWSRAGWSTSSPAARSSG